MPIDMQEIAKWMNLGGWLSGAESKPYDDPDESQNSGEAQFYEAVEERIPGDQRIPKKFSLDKAWAQVLEHMGKTETDKIWYVDSEWVDGQIRDEVASEAALKDLEAFDDQLWEESTYHGSYWFPPDQGGVEVGLYTHTPTGTKYCGCASTGSGSHKWLIF